MHMNGMLLPRSHTYQSYALHWQAAYCIECGYRLSFRLQNRASVSHQIAMIPFYQGIVAILSFCVLDTINFSNNPTFPSLFLNSDDSMRIVVILAKLCDDSSRNVTILTQNVTE